MVGERACGDRCVRTVVKHQRQSPGVPRDASRQTELGCLIKVKFRGAVEHEVKPKYKQSQTGKR